MGGLFRIGWNFNITSACIEADSQRHNKSLDASGVSRLVMDNLSVTWLTAAASTQQFDGVYSSEENMAIESNPRIVSTTVLGLR
jgi:hypothetical protein